MEDTERSRAVPPLFPSVFSVLKPPYDLMDKWLWGLCVKGS